MERKQLSLQKSFQLSAERNPAEIDLFYEKYKYFGRYYHYIMALKKHHVKTYFDEALIQDLADADEISISKDGRVYGLEKFIKRMWYKGTK